MISIIMSINKDRGRLDATIKSVLNQTFKDFEFIIVNDGGGIKLEEKLNKWKQKDNRIIIINNKQNVGLTKALNLALSKAKYKFIARIDEGDLWEDKKLEYQVKELKKNQDLVVVATGFYDVFWENNKIKYQRIRKIVTDDKEFRKLFLMGLNPIIHPSVIFKRKLLYNSSLIRSQDYELWLRLSFLGIIKGIDEPLVKYSREIDSISHNPYKSCQQLLSYYYIYKNFLRAIKNANYRKYFLKGISYSIKDKPCKRLTFRWKIYSKAKMFNRLQYKLLALLLIPTLGKLNLEKLKNRLLIKFIKDDYYY